MLKFTVSAFAVLVSFNASAARSDFPAQKDFTIEIIKGQPSVLPGTLNGYCKVKPVVQNATASEGISQAEVATVLNDPQLQDFIASLGGIEFGDYIVHRRHHTLIRQDGQLIELPDQSRALSRSYTHAFNLPYGNFNTSLTRAALRSQSGKVQLVGNYELADSAAVLGTIVVDLQCE